MILNPNSRLNNFYKEMFNLNNEKLPKSIFTYFLGWLVLLILSPIYLVNYFSTRKCDCDEIPLGFHILGSFLYGALLLVVYMVICACFGGDLTKNLNYYFIGYYVVPPFVRLCVYISRKTQYINWNTNQPIENALSDNFEPKNYEEWNEE